jgi:hypothetical protein
MSTEQEVNALRARIVELEERVEFLYKHLHLDAVAPGQVHPQIIEALKRNNLIEAIKIHREIYNTGLAEAKNAVERIKANLNL